MSAPKLTVLTIGAPKDISFDEGLAIIKRGLDPMREVFRKQAEDAAEMAELAARGARGELSQDIFWRDVGLTKVSAALSSLEVIGKGEKG